MSSYRWTVRLRRPRLVPRHGRATADDRARPHESTQESSPSDGQCPDEEEQLETTSRSAARGAAPSTAVVRVSVDGVVAVAIAIAVAITVAVSVGVAVGLLDAFAAIRFAKTSRISGRGVYRQCSGVRLDKLFGDFRAFGQKPADGRFRGCGANFVGAAVAAIAGVEAAR